MSTVLKDWVDVRAGYPFRGSVPQVPDGNALALQMRDLRLDGAVAWSGVTRTHIAQPAAHHARGASSSPWLRPGDVVFVARGARNYAVCLQQIPEPAVGAQHLFLLRPRSARLLPRFLAWQINRGPAQRYLASNAEGSAQRSIRRGVLEALPLSVPPSDEQALVVALADAVQREKALMEGAIRNRSQQQDALAAQLLAHAMQPDSLDR